MGLKATVYCDCYEKGRTLTPPPKPDDVSVDESGELTLVAGDLQDRLAFDSWRESGCEHENGILARKQISESLVQDIREELERKEHLFPVVLHRVLGNGEPRAEQLEVDELTSARAELQSLTEWSSPNAALQRAVRLFSSEMRDVVDQALTVGKAIAL